MTPSFHNLEVHSPNSTKGNRQSARNFPTLPQNGQKNLHLLRPYSVPALIYPLGGCLSHALTQVSTWAAVSHLH